MAMLCGSSFGRHGPGGMPLVFFSCSVAMAILFCLLHPASAVGQRHLLQGDEVLRAPLSICATLVDLDLIAQCRGVLMTAPSADFTPSMDGETCETHARNVVITRDQMTLYYILDQFCMFNGSRSKQSLSYWKAGMQGVDTGVASAATGVVLSHWWNTTAVNGPAEMEPTIFRDQEPAMAPMVYAYGLDLSPQESHLLVSGFALDSIDANISWVVMIDVENGSRVSIPVGAHLGYGLAFNPAKTHLYLSDASNPPRILVANMTGIEDITMDNFRPMAIVSFAAAAHVSRPIFNAHSFTANGSCLYFIDDRNNQVLGFNMLTETITILTPAPSASALLVANGGANAGRTGGPDYMFRGSLGEVATTLDGMYVFVSEFDGKLWKIKLAEPCGAPVEKSVVATYEGGGVWGLVVSDDIYMYVGTADGHISRLGLNLPTPTPA